MEASRIILESKPPTCYNLSMNVLTSVGILVLAVLACAFLRVAPSVFTVFYHYASAKNPRDKLLDLSSYFIIGTEAMYAVILFLLYFSLFYFYEDNPGLDMFLPICIFAGVLATLGIFAWCFYYRKGDATELYIPRRFAKSLVLQAKAVKKPSDIFALGLASGLTEMFFILPVLMVTVTEIINFPGRTIWQPLLMIFFIIITMVPLMNVRKQFHFSRKNLAEIERERVKNKTLHRILLGAIYVSLATALIVLRAL